MCESLIKMYYFCVGKQLKNCIKTNKMATENYVSFETAKLLKEKGFDIECDCLYVDGNIIQARGGRCDWNKGETILSIYKNECSAPTPQMVIKWLREVHNIAFDFDTYEEAREVGI